MRHITLMIAVIIGCSAATIGYWVYAQQQTNNVLLENIKMQMSQRSPGEPLPPVGGEEVSLAWGQVHEKVRDTVVQVFVYSALFNWLEPYKTPQQRVGVGSGFFIDASGLLITNAHVIDQYRAVYIQIPHFGKRRFDVEVIGVSPERDLALLRVIPEDLAIIVDELGAVPTLAFDDSDKVRRADEIMALGYPLGQQSLKSTVGVVSGRQHIDGHSLIQIDAPINQGNSGGPSLDTSGRVIGVNSSGIFEGGAQNVGYIIPSNEVKLFLRQLEDLPSDGVKFLRKPYLGISYGYGSDALAQYLHNPTPGGFYVVDVYPGSPLAKAGVLPGDVIYEVDGNKVDYFGEMSVPWSEDKISAAVDYVSRLMPGDTIHIVAYRNGARKELVAQFAFSDATPIRLRFPGYEVIDYEVVGGLVVMELTLNHLPILLQKNSQLVKYAELEHQMEPVIIITHILPDSEASKTRALHAGMIIKEINGKKVRTLEQFRQQVAESLQSNFLTIKTEGNVFAVLPFMRALRDEPKLASSYFYQITPLVRDFLKKVGSVEKAA